MDQADWFALGLLLAFLSGWFVAWLQESQYQKQKAQESERRSLYWCQRVAQLEKELEKVQGRVQE